MAFKTGNIVRVTVQNFLTFNDVTVYPEPYLNLIIGPNGSGKSTILCAICICLGGKPDVTGRSKNLESYVKHGKETATLEVELFIEGKSNVVIKRQFGSTISQWYLQGKHVGKKEIDIVVKKFAIQVDNLCTFLPQDRVANFARMNAVQLLEATEKAVGDPQLFEYHDVLCNSGSKMKEAQVKVQNWMKEIEILQKQNARLKEIMESVQEKKKLEEEIQNFEKQRIYHRYEKKRLNNRLIRDEIAVMDKDIKQEEKLLSPLNNEIKRCNESIVLQRRKLNSKIISYNEALQTINHIRTLNDKLGEDTKALIFDFEAKKEAEQQQKIDLENYKRQLDVLEGQFESLPAADEEEVRRKMQKLTQDISSASTKVADICNEIEELISEKQNNKGKIKSYQTQLEAAQDVTQQRFELLRKKNLDAYKAAKWLEDNREAFNSTFYMPICILINLSDPAYADVVESTISFSDLIAFVFHDQEDMNKFKSVMDRLKFRVNILHSVPSDLSSYKSPVPLHILRQWGFDTYMSDVIDAPPAILSYLHKKCRIHCIPIARKEIQSTYNNLPDNISLFFIGKLRVIRSRSRYDNECITESWTVREGSLLQIGNNCQIVSRCNEEMVLCQQRIVTIDRNIEELKKQEKDLTANLEAWRNDKQAYLCREQTRIQLQKRISAKHAQVKKCESQKFDEAEEERNVQNKLLRQFKSRINCVKEGAEKVSGTVLPAYFKLMGEMKSKGLYVKNMKEIIDQKGEKLKALQEERERKEEERLTVKREAVELLQKLCAALKVNSYDGITRELISSYSKMTEEETEYKLCDLKARRDCLLTADDQEIMDFNEREARISSLQKNLKSFQEKSSRQHEEIEKIRSLWLPSVTDLIQKISSSFTGFMERLGCSGEVELIHEDEHDYSKYGIAIYVKFRGADKLRVLTAQHQSGGERALATALYMLSLQNLTSVPFRCVDEINQGMDPVNERMMLSMLIETAAKEESSQYFFVSPKLLRGLQYSDRVNTMVVFNGPANVPKNQFSVKTCLRIKGKNKSREQKIQQIK